MIEISNKEIKLSENHLFNSMPKDKLAAIEQVVQEKNVSAQTIIFRQGDIADKFYIIASGAVRVFRESKEGIKTDLSKLGPGDHFGEMALVTESARSASIETTEATHLLVLDRDQFDQVLQNHPGVSLAFMKQMSGWLIRDEQNIEKEAVRQLITPRLSLIDFLIIIFVSIFFGLIFNKANPNGISIIPPSWSGEQISNISLSMAAEKHKDGETIFVDARPTIFYRQKHISGSVNVPEALFEVSYAIGLGGVDYENDIIVYGKTFSSRYDNNVARKLILRGHEHTMILKDGLDAWMKKGYPVQP